MNRSISRRRALGALAFASLAPLSAPLSAKIWASTPTTRFNPPSGALRFTRSLKRELFDGNSITTTRQFSVEFTKLGEGFALSGSQISAKVDAPKNLAELGKIEEARDLSGTFPMQIGSSGLIMGVPDQTQSALLGRAVDTALAQLREAGLPDAQEFQARAFIASMQEAASQASIIPPLDLFVPPADLRESTDIVPLGEGLTGSFTVKFSGNRDSVNGLMTDAARQIITDFEGDKRYSEERWELTQSDQ